MPPLRPTISALSRGYVCSSCIAKLRDPQALPASVRSLSSRRNKPAQSTQRPREKTAAPDNLINLDHFDQGEEGASGTSGTSATGDSEADRKLFEELSERKKELKRASAGLRAAPTKGAVDGTWEEKLEFLKSLNQALEKDGAWKEEVERGARLEADSAHEHGHRHGHRHRGPENRGPDARLAALELDIALPRLAFPREGQAYISRLNEALEKAALTPSKHRKELWRWYSLSRKTLAAAWNQVPPAAWKLLWDEFSVESLDNPDRMAHVITLASDMEAANVPLKAEQTLLYIEALFVDGSQEDALARWEESRPSLTLVDSTAAAYWALGVRMLAQLKQPARAQEAAGVLLSDSKSAKESRALIALIKSWSEFSDRAAIQIAWAVYLRFKFRMGDSMGMRDYDDVAGIFLAAHRTDLALAVFRDMMLTGDPLAKQYDSIALSQRLAGLKGTKNLESLQLDPQETSWISTEHLTALPPKFRNKFFFGSWIKKLIGDDEVDWAAQVIELMPLRKIRPDATYLNGIIGAWFRTNKPENHEKGAIMAWKMISARLEFVQQRSERSERSQSNLQSPLRPDYSHPGKDDFIRPSSISVSAQATLETFNVLIQHYQQLGQKERVQELIATLKAAQVKPNTAFLNNLIELGTAIHHRPWIWSLYARFAQQEGVVADRYTFVLLWKSMKEHVDPLINRTKSGYPSPRVLFAEMGLSPTWKSETLPRSLYDQIILCFGLSDDQVGSAVALRAMQKQYGLYPNEATVRSIVLQLAKAGVKNVAGFRPRRLNLNKDTQRRINDITKVMKVLKEERLGVLQQGGVDPDAMSPEDQAEESLKLLVNLLKFALETRINSNEALRMQAGVGGIDHLARTAAKEMGVSEELPWAP